MSRRGPTPKARWEPLRRSAGLVDEEKSRAAIEALGGRFPDEIWGSNLFSVTVYYATVEGVVQPRSELLWLSIHRRDRKAIRDWRHMQAIKNDVAGRDRVAVEIYPAEKDVVDTSNEYHLWVMPADFVLPFGLDPGGLLMTPEDLASMDGLPTNKARQRPWQPGLTTGFGERS